MPYKHPRIPDFQSRLRRAASAVETQAVSSLDTIVRREQIAFRQFIRGQLFESFLEHPLTPKYLAWKQKHGLDKRVMIATEHYVLSIRVLRTRPPAGKSARRVIGFTAADRAWDADKKPTDLPLRTLAAIHEYGTDTIPARPHWGPYKKDIESRLPKLREYMADDIRDALSKELR